MKPTPLLEVTGLSMHFGGIRALDGVGLTIGENEIIGVIGPNGAGKTTLFNVLTGTLRPTAGSVKFLGRELVGLPADAITRLGIARTYQKVRPFPRLTVLENVLVPIVNRAVPVADMVEARAIARDLLERVGLAEHINTEARRLNLFHRKKVELARALGANARILLLDEVMAGLTSTEADTAVDLLKSLREKYRFTIVCVEHLMRVIMTLSERVIVLDHGRVIAAGSPADVAADPAVQTAYLGGDYA
ncbi:MAG: ABC transporter ATP-binding protein [Burkholderiales bacterium]